MDNDAIAASIHMGHIKHAPQEADVEESLLSNEVCMLGRF